MTKFCTEIPVLPRATFPVSNGNNIVPAISRALLPMTSKADKLQLETEPDAHDNNTSWTLKPGHQTFVGPYSTDNHSNLLKNRECSTIIEVVLYQIDQSAIKVAQNSFCAFEDIFWWVIITTLYQLMLQSWYQKTAQLLENWLVSLSWHNRLP